MTTSDVDIMMMMTNTNKKNKGRSERESKKGKERNTKSSYLRGLGIESGIMGNLPIPMPSRRFSSSVAIAWTVSI